MKVLYTLHVSAEPIAFSPDLELFSQTQYPMTTCDWILLPHQSSNTTEHYTDSFHIIRKTPSPVPENDLARALKMTFLQY